MGFAQDHLTPAELEAIACRLLPDAKVSGGRVHAPCPWHNETTPGAWNYAPAKDWAECYSCGASGDVIDLYAHVRGLDLKEGFREFCRENNIAMDRSRRSVRDLSAPPAMKKIAREAQRARDFEPRIIVTPPELWQQKAVKLLQRAENFLANAPDRLQWLEARGIPPEAVKAARLGWLPRTEYRTRESWGLPTELRPDNKPKKLWLPAGLVIPHFNGKGLLRLRIRQAEQREGQGKYIVVSGGNGGATMLLHGDRPALVVVESELDALAVAHAVGQHENGRDIFGVLALGSNNAKPDEEADAALQRAEVILWAMDYEETGRGVEAWRWWQLRYPHVKRWPVPAGKDPGEFVAEHDGDMLSWLAAGLSMRLEARFDGTGTRKRPPMSAMPSEPPTHEDTTGNTTDYTEVGSTKPPTAQEALQAPRIYGHAPPWMSIREYGLEQLYLFAEYEGGPRIYYPVFSQLRPYILPLRELHKPLKEIPKELQAPAASYLELLASIEDTQTLVTSGRFFRDNIGLVLPSGDYYGGLDVLEALMPLVERAYPVIKIVALRAS